MRQIVCCLVLTAVAEACRRLTPAAWLRDYGDARLLPRERSRAGALRSAVFFFAFFAAGARPRAGSPGAAAVLILFCLLELTAADISHQILPDEWIALLLFAGARSPAGALPFFLLPLPLGRGDVKLLCALGFVLGAGPLLRLSLTAFGLAGLYAAALLLRGHEKKEPFAFAPFVLLGFMLLCFNADVR